MTSEENPIRINLNCIIITLFFTSAGDLIRTVAQSTEWHKYIKKERNTAKKCNWVIEFD